MVHLSCPSNSNAGLQGLPIFFADVGDSKCITVGVGVSTWAPDPLCSEQRIEQTTQKEAAERRFTEDEGEGAVLKVEWGGGGQGEARGPSLESHVLHADFEAFSSLYGPD